MSKEIDNKLSRLTANIKRHINDKYQDAKGIDIICGIRFTADSSICIRMYAIDTLSSNFDPEWLIMFSGITTDSFGGPIDCSVNDSLELAIDNYDDFLDKDKYSILLRRIRGTPREDKRMLSLP